MRKVIKNIIAEEVSERKSEIYIKYKSLRKYFLNKTIRVIHNSGKRIIIYRIRDIENYYDNDWVFRYDIILSQFISDVKEDITYDFSSMKDVTDKIENYFNIPFMSQHWFIKK